MSGCTRTSVAGVLAALSAALLAGVAGAQPTLYDNARFAPNDYGVVTGVVTASGQHAIVGAAWSEVAADAFGSNAIAGFAGGLTEPAGGFRFADDFVVPEGQRWKIDKLVFFAYHNAPSSNILLPFDRMNLRVLHGEPWEAESGVVYGDTTTQRVVAASPTNCFRIFNTVRGPGPATPDYSRNVMRIELATPGLMLAPGTYWLDWQFADSMPLAEVFVPPVTHPGQRGLVDANAAQYRPLSLVGGGQWVALVDPGKPSVAADWPQDLPFIVKGSIYCVGDINADGSLDLEDFFLFLNGFDQTLPQADVNTDGIVDLADFFMFLGMFDVGCQ